MGFRDRLAPVHSVTQIVDNVVRFNTIQAKDLPNQILRRTQYWVFDPDTTNFGPAKFVGFADMTLEVYQGASRDPECCSIFDGGRTKAAIEGACGTKFRPDDDLAQRLVEWGVRRFREDFSGTPDGKWAFIRLSSK